MLSSHNFDADSNQSTVYQRNSSGKKKEFRPINIKKDKMKIV